MKLSQSTIKTGESVVVNVKLTNTGSYDAEEVVQLYISDVEASVDVPLFSIKGFQKTKIKAGTSKEIQFEIGPSELELINEKGLKVLEKGDFMISVGGSLPTQRSINLGAPEYKQVKLSVI